MTEKPQLIPGDQPEPSDPTQCTGDEGLCPEHGFHRHSLKQTAVDLSDAISWMIPADQVQSMTISPPPVIAIPGSDGQDLVTIHTDGRLEYGPDYEPDEAARVFWDALRRWAQPTRDREALETAEVSSGPEQPPSTDPRCTCGHTKRDHSGRRDHHAKYGPVVAGRPWCHACETECIYCPPDPSDEGPIRKSLLPPVPPPEWELSAVLEAPHGVLLVPDTDTGPIVVRRRVTWGDWEPVRPDRWADEEPTDVASAPQAARANAPAPEDIDLTELREQIAEEIAKLACRKFEHPVPNKDHPLWKSWRAKADIVLATRDRDMEATEAEMVRRGETITRLQGRLQQLREQLAHVARLADEYPAGIDTALVLEAIDGQAVDDPEKQQLRAVLREVLDSFARATVPPNPQAIGYQGASIAPQDFERWQAALDQPQEQL